MGLAPSRQQVNLEKLVGREVPVPFFHTEKVKNGTGSDRQHEDLQKLDRREVPVPFFTGSVQPRTTDVDRLASLVYKPSTPR